MAKRTLISQFDGINNVDSAERLADSDLREATNVDIDDTKRVLSRKGYVRRYSGTNIHSFWSNESMKLFVEDGSLCLLNDDFTSTVLRTGINRFGKVVYTDINGDVYYTDDNVTGIIRSDGTTAPLGIPTPASRASLVSTTGILPAGKYGVSFTSVDAAGQESGPTLATYIDLSSAGAIEVTGTPSDAFNLYCTNTDGDTFYLYQSYDAGTSSVTITTLPEWRSLRTQYMEPMPSGHLIAEHAGRLLIARDNVLYYSEPWMYGLTFLTKNFIQFSSRITMVAPTDDGLFVSAGGETVFIFGRNPEEFSSTHKANYEALEGTATEVDPSAIGEGQAAQKAWMWLTKRGVCLGLTGGGFKNLTDKKFAPRVGVKGAGLFRELNGISQFISVLERNDSEADRLYTSDVAVAEVRRNGVIIT